jgi:superoxide dismutase
MGPSGSSETNFDAAASRQLQDAINAKFGSLDGFKTKCASPVPTRTVRLL